MAEHDPLRFAASFSGKLATRSRHVCAFLGAGTARACKLPDVAQLQKRVLSTLENEDKAVFKRILQGRNLEQALSRIRRIAALLTGDQSVDGLTAAQATDLDNKVCQAIVKKLDIKDAAMDPAYRLAAWAARANYHHPLELFTVNYDLVLETALERLKVPYFDGFIGSLRARFHTELVEATPGDEGDTLPAFFVRLWKLHGSVNWAWEQDHQIVRLGQPVTDDRAAAIYPSDAKYDESRRVPFVVLQDRFRRALHHPETLVIISGYSFSDEHLNEMLFDAATRCERSEFAAFCFSKIPEVLSTRAECTPNLQVVTGREAILAGIKAPWKEPKDAPPNLWEEDQFALRDYGHLAAYLARSTPESESMLRELVESAKEPEKGSDV